MSQVVAFALRLGTAPHQGAHAAAPSPWSEQTHGQPNAQVHSRSDPKHSSLLG